MKIWQTCPKCNGWGTTSDFQTGIYAETIKTCPVCNGAGVISIADGQPPKKFQRPEITINPFYVPTSTGTPIFNPSTTTSQEAKDENN